MKSKTDTLLVVMNVMAWIVCIGLFIKGGVYLVSGCASLFHPEATKNFYQKENLFALRQFSGRHFGISIGLLTAITIIEAYTALLFTKLFSVVKISSPFKPEAANILVKVSYYILVIWVIAMGYDFYAFWLQKQVDGLIMEHIPGEFLYLAGVVFVIGQIFKKGVELQTESELTV
ncbi:MAG TPA: DUF2975 domain-containing protein [Chitinophagaceae bacterium]